NQIQLERVVYKSGWFSSMVTVKEKDVPASEKTFKVLHGPIYWSKGSLGFGYGDLVMQEDPKISIRIGFKGGIVMKEVFNADQIKAWQEDFSADHMKLAIETNSEFSSVNTDLIVKAFAMKQS